MTLEAYSTNYQQVSNFSTAASLDNTSHNTQVRTVWRMGRHYGIHPKIPTSRLHPSFPLHGNLVSGASPFRTQRNRFHQFRSTQPQQPSLPISSSTSSQLGRSGTNHFYPLRRFHSHLHLLPPNRPPSPLRPHDVHLRLPCRNNNA